MCYIHVYFGHRMSWKGNDIGSIQVTGTAHSTGEVQFTWLNRSWLRAVLHLEDMFEIKVSQRIDYLKDIRGFERRNVRCVR